MNAFKNKKTCKNYNIIKLKILIHHSLNLMTSNSKC